MTSTNIRLLSEAERDRLVELIDIYNTATQVDREESAEFQALLGKLLNDGEEVKQTWTFCGHWEGCKIVVEYVLPGTQQDPREDVGYWPEGLWAAAGSGATQQLAQEAVIAEYEAAEHPDEED